MNKNKTKRRVFNFCLKCGAEGVEMEEFNRISCNQCGFVYFHGVRPSASLILFQENSLLMSVRAKEPSLGALEFVGGFVDQGESLEESLRREVNEELGIELKEVEYFGSFANNYLCNEVEYKVCDTFFIAQAKDLNFKPDPQEIKEVRWVNPFELDYRDLAFESYFGVLDKLKKEKFSSRI